MKKKRIFLFIVILAFLGACAHRVDIAMRPDYKAKIQPGHELANVIPALKFFKGEFIDRRLDPTKLTSFKQQVHTYNLYEERPIADALFEGLKAVIIASKQDWSEAVEGDIKVDLTFVNLQAARNAGLINVGATSSIQIKVDFLNAKTGDLVYSNVYAGSDDRSQAMIGLIGMVKESIDASILRCMQSIGDDAALAKTLTKIQI